MLQPPAAAMIEAQPEAKLEVKPEIKPELKPDADRDQAPISPSTEPDALPPPPVSKAATEALPAPDAVLAHAPDDPGPGSEPAADPVPQPKRDTATILRSWFSRGAVR
jgi:hypothetical protein